jgi:Protein of unknown function (DUF3551)
MRLLLFVLGILVGTAAIGTRAEAQNYPWCAVYGNGFGGENCGFVSFEQCMATVSGIGGFCERNTMYVPPAGASGRRYGAPGRHYRPRHDHHHRHY